MKILVTGATGFIGSWVVIKALERGAEVLALRRTVGSSLSIPTSEEPTWITKPIQELCCRDLIDVQAVVHLASAGVSPKIASPAELAFVNIELPMHFAALLRESNVRRLVVAGTCYEYGLSCNDYELVPVSACLRPVNLYGASKAACFHMLSILANQYSLELVYCRIFTAYGLGQSSMNFWPALKEAAAKGKDFNMTSGEQTRDFIPVDEVAGHLLAACVRPDVNPSVPKVLNIGSGIPTRLKDFARQQWASFKSSSTLNFGAIASRNDNIPRMVADIGDLNDF